MDCENEQNDCSDFSDEDLGMLKKALPVEIPENFHPNKIPENGEEYLQHVMYEAKNCPKLKVAENLPAILNRPAQPTHISIIQSGGNKMSITQAPSRTVCPMAWQEETSEIFKDFRELISTLFKHVPRRKFVIDESFSMDPKLSMIATLSQEEKSKLLEGLLTQMCQLKKGNALPKIKCLWIYTLLAALDTPLSPDTCHLLREISRKCAQIRSEIVDREDLSNLTSLNLIVCVVARCFGQMDLADDTE